MIPLISDQIQIDAFARAIHSDSQGGKVVTKPKEIMPTHACVIRVLTEKKIKSTLN